MRYLLLLCLLLVPRVVEAQTACTSTATPAPVVFGRSTLTFQSTDHNAVDPAGALKVTDYFGEVRVKNNPALVTNFTVPKASVVPVTGSGVPADCLSTLLPGMQGLLPANIYTLTFFARNPSGVQSENPNTVDFFLSSASVPVSPGNLSLVTP